MIQRLTISLVLLLFAAQCFAQISANNVHKVKLLSQIKGHTGPVFTMAFSSNGKLLVTGGSAQDHSVRVWDTPSATPHGVLEENQKQVAAVGFSSDSTKVLSAGYDGTIRVWDLQGKLITSINQTAEKTPLSITNLLSVFSADGTKFAYSNDMGEGPFVFDMNSHKQMNLNSALEGSGSPGAIAINSNGSQLAVVAGETGIIYVIDTNSGKATAVLKPVGSPGAGQITISKDNSMIAASNDATSHILIFDAASQKQTAELKGHRENSNGTFSVMGIAFSPDGKLLTSASYDKSVRVWDTTSGKQLTAFEAVGKGPSAAAWSPDQTIFATADLSGTISLWGVH
jgi:DNA-binding beta-propeller fold protein YncE